MLAQAIWRYKLNFPAVQFPQLFVQLKQVIKRGLGEVDEKIDVAFFCGTNAPPTSGAVVG